MIKLLSLFLINGMYNNCLHLNKNFTYDKLSDLRSFVNLTDEESKSHVQISHTTHQRS